MRVPLPSNERERLDAVARLRPVDVRRDGRLAEIVSLAAEICGTPMAAIAVVEGDEVRFIERHGFEVDVMPRDESICTYAILEDRTTVVSDAGTDARLFDRAIVTGPMGVRFYAGSPLIETGGHAIGTLCVMADEAGGIDAAQQSALEVLGRQAMAQIKLAALEDDQAGLIDDLDMARRNLDFLASHDALTGVYNRNAVIGVIEGLVPLNESGAMSTAVLFIDIDDFEDVNDSLGHDAGDRVLVTLADRIHLGARNDDVIARLAGDQFVVVIPNAPFLAPEQMARRVLQMASGDAAMRYAKAEGKNRLVIFEVRVAAHRIHRINTHSFVRSVVSEGSMRLDFQPLWSMTSGAVIAHEALLRWDSPGAPNIDPGEFVATAEALGLVGEITRFTIIEACRLATRRREAGERNAAVTVNLSSVQLERDEVILVVATALNDSGLAPSGLILELTESAKLAESGSGQATLRELQNMGVRVALDDFGTGFSSLALLRSFPFDFMKIDRTFVTGVTDADREVLRSLVQLGHSLGMMVVAEGIEDATMLRQLQEVGCDVVQGYLLGRPGPAEPPRNMESHPLITPASRFH
ncbi:MAG: putative diguanylate cyclase/phosphodiesterase with PAS sensor [Acidimicrobiaceae bacterium]|nr:MAG: putative diguanylate cyclase/phosphodiesterase with PAS sensor [Acidimicrobiaceae bacterium]